MCGIVGLVSERNVTSVLVEGLRRLEYRGYDSAGISVASATDMLRLRATGKLKNLQKRLKDHPVTGLCGIGHTRWATHGAPTRDNAHPHCSEKVAVVHNGIIENFLALRQSLEAEGVSFKSDTDTEVIPHLIERELNRGLDPVSAVRVAIGYLKGAFALGIIFHSHDNLLVAARRGSPLIVGLGDGENFIGSDATPLVAYTRRMIYLDDDDIAVLSREGVTLMDLDGNTIHRPVRETQVQGDIADKGQYRHFMLKEIFEQPSVIGETLRSLVDLANHTVNVDQIAGDIDFSAVQSIHIIACGTSWHAGMVAKYWIEQLAKIPVNVDIASEYRYRRPPPQAGCLGVTISQSGETADTLAALRYARSELGQKILSIVNVPESSIARDSDSVIYTQAGPEIGVASTKAFTTQLVALSVLALALAKARNQLSSDQESALVSELLQIPGRMEQVLTKDTEIQDIARELMHASGFLFLGRGTCFPIALEGALKLKEISYIHAEGYAAGEMKHGPIALIDEDLPVVVVAPRDNLYEKVISNVEEVNARGGRVVVITTESETGQDCKAGYMIPMVACGELAAPILYVAPLQLLAYHIAVYKGTDVDQPRNLAKSVTVE
ncbi:MAG: glutamine--fructose-6-phosphate transaminase (isomerizing) [Magnetococcales bacterium]|nr:glutamine--fructose-6-phosphate transaminase (isomerizing) [Magnetococcales bacterium]